MTQNEQKRADQAAPEAPAVDLSGYPVLMTVPQVCEITQLGKSTVYQLLEEKVIVSVKMGGSIRVPRAALASYIRLCTRGLAPSQSGGPAGEAA
jgi:excisionase family DNA binding protein